MGLDSLKTLSSREKPQTVLSKKHLDSAAIETDTAAVETDTWKNKVFRDAPRHAEMRLQDSDNFLVTSVCKERNESRAGMLEKIKPSSPVSWDCRKWVASREAFKETSYENFFPFLGRKEEGGREKKREEGV